MATTKKAVTFYATPEVAKWVDGLDAGDKSRKINDVILEVALKPRRALFEVPLDFYQMSDLLELLKLEVARRERESEEAEPPDNDEQRAEQEEYFNKPLRLLGLFEKFVR